MFALYKSNRHFKKKQIMQEEKVKTDDMTPQHNIFSMEISAQINICSN